ARAREGPPGCKGLRKRPSEVAPVARRRNGLAALELVHGRLQGPSRRRGATPVNGWSRAPASDGIVAVRRPGNEGGTARTARVLSRDGGFFRSERQGGDRNG